MFNMVEYWILFKLVFFYEYVYVDIILLSILVWWLFWVISGYNCNLEFEEFRISIVFKNREILFGLYFLLWLLMLVVEY